MSLHALHRSQHRGIPQVVIDTIMEYGQRCSCRDSAHSYSLDKASMRQIKSDFGGRYASMMAEFRNAYVVVADGKVVTVAWKRKKIGSKYWRQQL